MRLPARGRRTVQQLQSACGVWVAHCSALAYLPTHLPARNRRGVVYTTCAGIGGGGGVRQWWRPPAPLHAAGCRAGATTTGRAGTAAPATGPWRGSTAPGMMRRCWRACGGTSPPSGASSPLTTVRRPPPAARMPAEGRPPAARLPAAGTRMCTHPSSPPRRAQWPLSRLHPSPSPRSLHTTGGHTDPSSPVSGHGPCSIQRGP